jgi:hypothetical protein
VERKPSELLIGEALQSFDRAQGANDICDALSLFRVFDFQFHWSAIEGNTGGA